MDFACSETCASEITGNKPGSGLQRRVKHFQLTHFLAKCGELIVNGEQVEAPQLPSKHPTIMTETTEQNCVLLQTVK